MARAVSRPTTVEARGDFDPYQWRLLAEAERLLAVRRLIVHIVREMGIPDDRAPAVGAMTDPALAGETRWSLHDHAGAIDINITEDAAGEVVATIVHECRHYFQKWNGYQSLALGVDLDQLHPRTSVWRTNDNSFASGSYNEDTSDPGYFIQPVEIDAENFARFVLEWLQRRLP